jgi:hypothetical protein
VTPTAADALFSRCTARGCAPRLRSGASCSPRQAHIHLGFRWEVGPIVATLKKPMAASSTTRTPVHRIASSTTPVYQTAAPVTTTVPQTTAFQATTPRRPPRSRKPPPSGPTRALGRRGLSASSLPAAA